MIATWCVHAAEELLQTTCMGWQRAETLIFHQPSPDTRIAEVSNNTKGLFYLTPNKINNIRKSNRTIQAREVACKLMTLVFENVSPS